MKKTNIKLFKKHNREIPIFFATDDNYVPFLDVTIRSLIANASKKYKYVINVIKDIIQIQHRMILFVENVMIFVSQKHVINQKEYVENAMNIITSIQLIKQHVKNVMIIVTEDHVMEQPVYVHCV